MYEYMVPVLYRYLAHARLRLSRLVVSTLELIGGSGRTGHRRPLRVCKRVCCARLHLIILAFISPTAFEQARGGALGAGGGRVGFAGGGLF